MQSANDHPITAAPGSPRAGVQRTTVAGAELRYLRTGAGRPAVLLHTLRTQLEMFDAVIERLEPSPVDVIAVDLPGHGHSSAPRVDYTADYFSDVVAELLEQLDLHDVVLVGESIGATTALTITARGNPRVRSVIAVNPYDYGRWGGIRRSSPLANALFTAIHWPGIGALVAHGETRTILRAVLRGGLYDRRALPAGLVEELYRSGSRDGDSRALRSLCRSWRSFIDARERYPHIAVPVTLVYGDHDWSRPSERAANARALPGAGVVTLERCGHFASLEHPDPIASLIEAAAQ